jgi:hypothetical protein
METNQQLVVWRRPRIGILKESPDNQEENCDRKQSEFSHDTLALHKFMAGLLLLSVAVIELLIGPGASRDSPQKI